MDSSTDDEEEQRSPPLLSTVFTLMQEDINILMYKTERLEQSTQDEIKAMRQETLELKRKVHSLEETEAELQSAILMLRQKPRQEEVSVQTTTCCVCVTSNDDSGEETMTLIPTSISNEETERSMLPSVLLRNIMNDDGLPLDTFTLMMTSKSCTSLAWCLGMVTFAFQMTLVTMISIDQVRDSIHSSIFNVPFKVDNVVRVGQVLTIIFTLATQNDVISSIRFGVMFWNYPRWDRIVLRRSEDNPPPTNSAWRSHILIPNALKFLQGFLMLFVTTVLIVQSDNIINLLKEFTALMALSETDNVIFWLAVNGYLGGELQRNTIRAREIEIQDEVIAIDDEDPRHTSSSTSSGFLLRSIILLSITLLMIGGWVAISFFQINGTFFYRRYPNCVAPEDQSDLDMFDLAKQFFGDGTCYGGPLNTLGCEFEDGDCVNYNLAFPTCKGVNRTHVQESVGNGICDEIFMHEDCDYDGGDCCPYSIIKDPSFGDGHCNGGIYGTKRCGYDNGDCNDFIRAYPDCPLDDFSVIEGSSGVVLKDGFCDSGIYNIKECGNEFGDCDDGQFAQEININERIGFGDDVFFNTKISLSGDTIAIGLYGTDESGNFDAKNPGFVKMMRYNPMTKVWAEHGGYRILGDASRDNLGATLALSFSGNRIAANVNSGVKVFQLDQEVLNGSWKQIGQTIRTDSVGGGFDITSDGSRLAIADSEQNAGKIIVYDLDSSFPVISKLAGLSQNTFIQEHQREWGVTLGQNGIQGKAITESIGSWNVQLNSLDGSRVLFSVGAPYSQLSMIRVYQYDVNDSSSTKETWTQMGNDIESPYTSSSKISADGSRIAISLYSTDIDTPGKVIVLDYDIEGNEWVRIGNPIISSNSMAGDGFGFSLSLSSDGNFLGIVSNTPNCQFSPNSFDTGACATNSIEFFSYESYTRTFNRSPRTPLSVNVQGNILDLKNLSDRRSTFGLHFSMSGDATTILISGYNFDEKYAFVKTFALDELFYTKCAVTEPDEISNGACYNHAPYNTEVCGFDGGDCIVENYPHCLVPDPDEIGNGFCNLSRTYNTENCGFDGGDCEQKQVKGYNKCFVAEPEEIGNGKCTNYSPYNTADCGFDGGDCVVSDYPNCFVDSPELINDGECNDEAPYNTESCGFDGGDCILVSGFPNCYVGDPNEVRNGNCEDLPPFNTKECGFDGGDCNHLPVKFYPGCFVHQPDIVGDGLCQDHPPYNTIECGFDGGDCIFKPVPGYPHCNTHNPELIGDGVCDDLPPYNTEDCGSDGGDCIPNSV